MSVGSQDLVATVRRLLADRQVRRLRITAMGARTHLEFEVPGDAAAGVEEPGWLPLLRVVAELSQEARIVVEREPPAQGGTGP